MRKLTFIECRMPCTERRPVFDHELQLGIGCVSFELILTLFLRLPTFNGDRNVSIFMAIVKEEKKRVHN